MRIHILTVNDGGFKELQKKANRYLKNQPNAKLLQVINDNSRLIAVFEVND